MNHLGLLLFSATAAIVPPQLGNVDPTPGESAVVRVRPSRGARSVPRAGKFHARLALRWAPIHVQRVSTKGSDSLRGRSDYITSINFDGEWDTANNWANARRFPLKAHCYYSVVETATHWYILYAFYHPRDWARGRDFNPLRGEFGILSKSLDTHENDMQGLLAIVRRPGRVGNVAYGELLAVVTQSHRDFYSYLPARSYLRSGREDIDGRLSFLPHQGVPHPITVGESKGHGIKVWRAARLTPKCTCKLRLGWLSRTHAPDCPLKGCRCFPLAVGPAVLQRHRPDCAAIKRKGPVVHGKAALGSGVVYYPSLTDAQVPQTGRDRKVLYKLVDIFEAGGFWANRREALKNDKEFPSTRGKGGEIGMFAKAPWGWDDWNDKSPSGAIAVDPARLAQSYFRGLKGLSLDYVLNPYRPIEPQLPKGYRAYAFLVDGFRGCCAHKMNRVSKYLRKNRAYVQYAYWNSLYRTGDPGKLFFERRVPIKNFKWRDASPDTDRQFQNELRAALRRIPKSTPVILIGHSLGGGAVIRAAISNQDRRIAFLGVLDPVASTRNPRRSGLPGFPGKKHGRIPATVDYFYNKWQENGPLLPLDFRRKGRLDSSAKKNHQSRGNVQRNLQGKVLRTGPAKLLKKPMFHSDIPEDDWVQSEIIDALDKTVFIKPRTLVALKALANGKYVSARNGRLISNADRALESETFALVDLGNGRKALRAIVNDKFVCAEKAGKRPLIANRFAASTWETFKLVDLGRGRIALRACNGKYVCADSAGRKPLIANRDRVGKWETFLLVRRDQRTARGNARDNRSRRSP